MTRKPDPKALRRATAQVAAEHRPRQLHREPRLSIADEQAITDQVRRAESDSKQAARAELAITATHIADRVQTLRDAMHAGIVTTRGERNLARRIAHDLDVLTGMLESQTDRGVH